MKRTELVATVARYLLEKLLLQRQAGQRYVTNLRKRTLGYWQEKGFWVERLLRLLRARNAPLELLADRPAEIPRLVSDGLPQQPEERSGRR